jgi:hypothetical protein
MLIGSGTILVGRVLGPFLSKFVDDSPIRTNYLAGANSKNFRIDENKKVMSIYDSSGEEIFQIDKEA